MSFWNEAFMMFDSHLRFLSLRLCCSILGHGRQTQVVAGPLDERIARQQQVLFISERGLLSTIVVECWHMASLSQVVAWSPCAGHPGSVSWAQFGALVRSTYCAAKETVETTGHNREQKTNATFFWTKFSRTLRVIRIDPPRMSYRQ